MYKINSTIMYGTIEKFNEELSKTIGKFQAMNLIVEVQYSTQLFNGRLLYSALILGKSIN